MKHRVKGRKLSRKRNQRRALLKTLLGSLALNGKIVTTEAKAKELKPKIDKIINRIKIAEQNKNKLKILRDLQRILPVAAVKKLTSESFISRYVDRTGGFTRVTKLPRRKSDSAKMAVIEFV